MALTLELATFIVQEGEKASLLGERPQMIAALGRAFPGLVGAWLAKRDDGLRVGRDPLAQPRGR